jgi:hypothetical protein
MKMTPRELVLLFLTFAALLFGVSWLVVRQKITEWKDIRVAKVQIDRNIEVDRRMIDSRNHWNAKLATLRELLEEFEEDADVDTHWMSIMDDIASKHGVNISDRKAGAEKPQGEVYELAIECKEWDGELKSLVDFLFELQSKGAMLDIRQLRIKPKPKAGGRLEGAFTLHCAYTRKSEEGG